MTTAKDSLGRNRGYRFNMAAIKRELEKKRITEEKKFAARAKRAERERQYRLDNPAVISFR